MNKTTFETVKLDKQEITAIQMVYAGDANEGQQRLALYAIVNKICRAHDLLYVPGSFDESAFLSGRAYVGAEILRYLNIPVGKLKDQENTSEQV